MARPGFYTCWSTVDEMEIVKSGANRHRCSGGHLWVGKYALIDEHPRLQEGVRVASPTIHGFAPLCDGFIKRGELYLARKHPEFEGIMATTCMYCAVYFYEENLGGDFFKWREYSEKEVNKAKENLINTLHELSAV